jgi:hypothetical protein
MKKIGLVCALALLAPCLHAQQRRQLLPMGSLLQCTTEEKISSARVEIGDPILCRITRFTVYGQQVLPYGSYLSGTFDEYKDPGHLVGKGWMVVRFDRIVLPYGASGAMKLNNSSAYSMP